MLLAYVKNDARRRSARQRPARRSAARRGSLRLFPAGPGRALPRRRSARHRLRREIIATVAANDLVNRAGIAFARELGDADRPRPRRGDARLYDRAPHLRSRRVLGQRQRARQQGAGGGAARDAARPRGAPRRARDGVVPARARRSTSPRGTQAYRPGIAALADAHRPRSCRTRTATSSPQRAAALDEQGVPPALARTRGAARFPASRPSTSCASRCATQQDVVELGRRFFAIGARFRLDALRVAARKLDAAIRMAEARRSRR